MSNEPGNWKVWGKRLRAHVRESGVKTWAQIASELGQAESTVRSWCNGSREVNLSDFFRLCEVTKADAARVLFGKIPLSDEERLRLGSLVASVLEADPSISANYAPAVKALKVRRKHKATKLGD